MPEAYTVLVDYGLTVEKAFQAGDYDTKDYDMEGLSLSVWGEGRRPVEIELMHFNALIKSDQAAVELEKRDLRPANLVELLALGAHYPDLQRQFRIVALGVGEIGDFHQVAVLMSHRGSRHITFFHWNWTHQPDCRFAAVKKS